MYIRMYVLSKFDCTITYICLLCKCSDIGIVNVYTYVLCTYIGTYIRTYVCTDIHMYIHMI